MDRKIQIGDKVTIKGKGNLSGRVIDIYRSAAFMKPSMAVVGWRIKKGNLTFLSTKKVLLRNLELYKEKTLIDVIRTFFSKKS